MEESLSDFNGVKNVMDPKYERNIFDDIKKHILDIEALWNVLNELHPEAKSILIGLLYRQ